MRKILLVAASALFVVGPSAVGMARAQGRGGDRGDIYSERGSRPTYLERLLQRDSEDDGDHGRADSDDEMDSGYGRQRGSDDFDEDDGGGRDSGRASRDEL
jgi:hypothetical protein